MIVGEDRCIHLDYGDHEKLLTTIQAKIKPYQSVGIGALLNKNLEI